MPIDTEKIPTTTMRVSVKTKERLAKLGVKDDTYDDVVVRILDFYEANKDRDSRLS